MWRALTGLSILVLGGLLVGLIILMSSVLGYLQPVLVPLAVAGIIAYLLDPVVRFIQRRWNLSRFWGIAIVFSGFLLFVGSLSYFIYHEVRSNREEKQAQEKAEGLGQNPSRLPFTFNSQTIHEKLEDPILGPPLRLALKKNRAATVAYLETGGNLIDHQGRKWTIPRGEETLQPVKRGIADNIDAAVDSPLRNELLDTRRLLESDWEDFKELGETPYPHLEVMKNNFFLTRTGSFLQASSLKLLGWLSSNSGQIFGLLGIPLGLILVPIYLYYLLKESNSIKETWQDYVPLKASKFKTEVVDTLQEINGYLISFFRGQVFVAFIDGILVGIALTIYQLPYGLLIGVVMAFLGIIPYIGNIICLIPACLIAYFHGVEEQVFGLPAWGYVLGVVLIFVVVQQINSLVTAPRIVGDSVGLHPMTVIFSVLFWTLLLGGFLGALLAVPLTAAVKVLFRRYVWDKKMAMHELGEPTSRETLASA